jgi:hypothetical protein
MLKSTKSRLITNDKRMKKKIILTISVALIVFIVNAQWQQTSLNTGTFRGLAVNGVNIFAGKSFSGNDSAKVFLSTNEGSNWTEVLTTPSDVWSIAVDGTSIFAGTYGSGIFLSNNNGGSWILLTAGPYDVTALAASGTNIFAGTDGNGLFYSLNNGATWSPANVNMYTVLSLNINGVNIFSGTHMVGIYLSDNNGATWTSKGLMYKDIWSLSSNGSNSYAGTDDTIYLSTDIGTNWIPVFNTGFNCTALAAFGTNIFAGTRGGGVFLSTNNGISWTSVNQGLTSLIVYSLAISDSNVFLGTDNGGVWKRPLNELVTGVNENTNSNAQVIIYPNPLRTSSTIIINSVFKMRNFELKIYNLFGQEIKKFINISRQNFTINKGNLTNGIYFYKLIEENRVIATGNFITE